MSPAVIVGHAVKGAIGLAREMYLKHNGFKEYNYKEKYVGEIEMVLEKVRASFYVNKGHSSQDSGQLDVAEQYYLKALSLLKKLKNTTERRTGIALQYSNLGLLYHQQGKIEEAISNLEKAISIYTTLGNTDDCAPIYASVGKAYFDVENDNKAEDALRKALSIYSRRKGPQESIKTINSLLESLKQRKERIH